MPVSLDDHDPDIELTPGTTKSDVVAFLYQHDEYGYTPREVHEELDIPHNTAKVTLKRLYDNEFIEKTADGYYHARADRDDLYRYLGA
ncbi:MarR family transcriptional regulator, partial [Halorubrum sp. GN11GM_10-3_MGM]